MTNHPSPQYNAHGTPTGASTEVVRCSEKWFQIGKVLAYFAGSVLFLVGSILFYPKYMSLWNGQGGVIGAWTFFFGCICFLIGTNGDFIDIIRHNSGTPMRRVINGYIGMTYVMAAAIFQLGALYFLPDWYIKSPSLGCYSFIVGCVQFCLASFVDLVFIVVTPKGVQLGNLKCWGTVVALGCFLGGVFFILGSYYYLPKFIAQDDTNGVATDYMYKAINYYVIGSVFFVINAVAQVPDMLASFKAGQPKMQKETADFA